MMKIFCLTMLFLNVISLQAQTPPKGTPAKGKIQSAPAAQRQQGTVAAAAANGKTLAEQQKEAELKKLGIEPSPWIAEIKKDGFEIFVARLVRSNPQILLIPLILIFLGIAYLFLMYKIRPPGNLEEMASSGRFAHPDEIVTSYPYEWGKGGLQLGYLIDEKEQRVTEANILDKNKKVVKKIKDKNGIMVGIPALTRTEHVSTEAGTGAGKSTLTVYPPLIEDAYSNIYNIFFADRKGEEAYRDTGHIWKTQGHKVLYLNPWDPALTHSIEPLYGADPNEVKSIVLAHIGILIDQNSALKIYRDMEERLLTNLIFAAQKWSVCQGPNEGNKCKYSSREESERIDPTIQFSKRCMCRRHLCTLPALGELVGKGPDVTKRAIEKYPEISEKIFSIWDMGKSDIGKFFNGIQNKLGLYLDPEMAHAFSRADFHLKELVPSKLASPTEKGAILYLGISQSYTASSALLASVIIQLLVNQIFRRRDWMLRHGYGMEQMRLLNVKLDEIFSYSVQNFDEFQAIARSAGCAIEAAYQADVQAKKYYLPEMPEIMRTNFNTKLYLNGCSYKTAQELSDSFGKRAVAQRSKSWGSQGIYMRSDHTASETERSMEVPLITPDQIIKMPKNQILVNSRLRPFRVEGVPYYNNTVFADLVTKSQKEILNQRILNTRCDQNREKRALDQPQKPRYRQLDLVALGLDQFYREAVGKSKGDPIVTAQQIESMVKKVGWLARNGHTEYGKSDSQAKENVEKIAWTKFSKKLEDMTSSEWEDMMKDFRTKEQVIHDRNAANKDRDAEAETSKPPAPPKRTAGGGAPSNGAKPFSSQKKDFRPKSGGGGGAR